MCGINYWAHFQVVTILQNLPARSVQSQKSTLIKDDDDDEDEKVFYLVNSNDFA